VVETPAAPVAPAPVETKPVDLASAGLVMIETTSAPAAPAAPEPQVQLGRKPRPAAVVADEPLQMVETRNP
jgi:ribonuclease E